jgi:hypothetical protein
MEKGKGFISPNGIEMKSGIAARIDGGKTANLKFTHYNRPVSFCLFDE